MEVKYESKIVDVEQIDERIFSFLSDLSHLGSLIPADKAKIIESTSDTCVFEIPQLGKFGIRIVEKDPFKLIKLAEIESKHQFNFWIQIKPAGYYRSKMRLSMKIDINPVMKMMVNKKLQDFIDQAADQLSKLPY